MLCANSPVHHHPHSVIHWLLPSRPSRRTHGGPVHWEQVCVGLLLGAVMLLATGCAQMGGSSTKDENREIQAGTVSVTTSNPARFTPTQASARETKTARAAWVEALSEHMADQIAKALPDGERAEVHITDVRRAAAMAGSDPSGAQVVPPRIALDYKRLSSAGKTIKTASRTLQDPSLQIKATRYGQDPLRYEKALVDAWVAKEFGATSRP